jgi:hypothetical protein
MEHLKQQANSKRKLKLGDIAEHLQVKKFVVRTWEKELGLAPQSGGYDADGVELFKKIKQLVIVEHQSLDQVRQVIGASKITSTIQPAMLEYEDDAISSLGMTPTTEQSFSSENFIILSEKTMEINAHSLQEPVYVPAEALQATQEDTTTLMSHATAGQQEKFFSDLALFKQELIRLQALLKA